MLSLSEGLVRMHSSTDQVLERCVQEAAHAAASDRRLQRRYPFFRPITISTDVDERTKLSAFSRDISPAGVGLLHGVPLSPGRVGLKIPLTTRHQLDVSAEIGWCAPAGEGWYLSGGRFLRLSAPQVTSLLFAVVKGEASRRLQQRHPFFRPVTITTGGGTGTKLSAVSRDISRMGIGLLHSMPLDAGRVMLQVPSTTGHELDICAELRWCAPASEGWYVSGGRFVRLLLEEAPHRFL